MNRKRAVLIVLASCLIVALSANNIPAKYGSPQLQDVPIARLVENLEKIVAAQPNDVAARLNLARVHAMAYAEKIESTKASPEKGVYGPWWWPTAKEVPFKVVPTDDPVKIKMAKDHLNKAITRYQESIALDGKNLTAKLGLAWCLDQAKKKEEAIKAYREVVELGWQKDMNAKSLKSGKAITIEAAGYLLPLLDKEKDKQEIATLEQRVSQLNQLKKVYSPVVIPLRDGLTAYDMVNPAARVRFDVDGSGFNDQWTWFTKDAGILVFDPHGKRKITSGIQWFGNVTFWMFWDNGYDALRALDDNGDSVLSGKELTGICVWIDANGDGACQPGEIKTLAELGIIAISCRYQIDDTHPDRVPFSRGGVTFRDGTTRTTFDVYLRKW